MAQPYVFIGIFLFDTHLNGAVLTVNGGQPDSFWTKLRQ